MGYATAQGVRDIGVGTVIADATLIDDALIDAGLAYAEDLIDDYTGTSHGAVGTAAYKAFTVTLDGTGVNWIRLRDPDHGGTLMFPRSLTAVTIDSVTVASGVFSAWALKRHGIVVRGDGTFPTSTVGSNIVIAGTAGMTDAPPERVARAAKLIAREYALAAQDRTHLGAITVADQWGTTVLAQPGKHGPTPIPAVNDILKRLRRRPAGMA